MVYEYNYFNGPWSKIKVLRLFKETALEVASGVFLACP